MRDISKEKDLIKNSKLESSSILVKLRKEKKPISTIDDKDIWGTMMDPIKELEKLKKGKALIESVEVKGMKTMPAIKINLWGKLKWKH